jgi:poly(3-hydroxybutyrate) depolymerase
MVGTGGSAGAGGVRTGGATASGGIATGGVVGTGGAGTGGAGTGGVGTGGSVGSGGVGTGGASATGGTPGTGGLIGTGGAGARSSGCGKTSSLSFGTVPGEGGTVGTGDGGYITIQSSGQSRGFAMRLPDNYDNNRPYWLIFAFHWNNAGAREVDTGKPNGYTDAYYGLQKLSNNGAIFVAPQGVNGGWANSNGQDLTFVDDMVKVIEDNYCVDPGRLYANGFNFGGGMTYAIACARATVFRAVAIYNGAALSGCVGGNDPIAYWQMGGLTDGMCTLNSALPMRDKFALANGCTLPANEPPRPPAPTPYLSPGGHICTDYTGCSSGHPLRWCVHQSGTTWEPVDGTGDAYNSCATPPSTCSTTCPCTWVPQDVWSFFTSL